MPGILPARPAPTEHAFLGRLRAAVETCERECLDGYLEGRSPLSIPPGPNRHPAFLHGWANGREDAEIALRLRKHPAESAAARRARFFAIIQGSL